MLDIYQTFAQTAAHPSSHVWWDLSVLTVTGCTGVVCQVTRKRRGKDIILFRTNCNEAADIELTLSLEDRKTLNRVNPGMWPLTRSKIR